MHKIEKEASEGRKTRLMTWKVYAQKDKSQISYKGRTSGNQFENCGAKEE